VSVTEERAASLTQLKEKPATNAVSIVSNSSAPSRKKRQSGSALKVVPRALPQKKKRSFLLRAFRSSLYFEDTPEDVLEEIIDRVKEVCLAPNETVIMEGDVGREMYIIEQGEVCVTNSRGHELKRMKDGELFGELAVIQDTTRSATVTTTSPSHIFVVDRKLIRHQW